MVYGKKTVRMVAYWLVPGILVLPFVVNFCGGLMAGLTPWRYLVNIQLVIMILVFNSGNALLGFLSFRELSRSGYSFLISLTPSIIGAGAMVYFNFWPVAANDPYVGLAIIMRPLSSIPCFVVPWILIATVGSLSRVVSRGK